MQHLKTNILVESQTTLQFFRLSKNKKAMMKEGGIVDLQEGVHGCEPMSSQVNLIFWFYFDKHNLPNLAWYGLKLLVSE